MKMVRLWMRRMTLFERGGGTAKVSLAEMVSGSRPEIQGRSLTNLGALFESLVTLNVRVFADAIDARTSHLRVHRGDHEIDLIVEGQGGQVVALEVKLSGEVDDDDVRHLKWLQREIGDELVDAAIITTGEFAYRRKDGIAVIPAALLGP